MAEEALRESQELFKRLPVKHSTTGIFLKDYRLGRYLFVPTKRCRSATAPVSNDLEGPDDSATYNRRLSSQDAVAAHDAGTLLPQAYRARARRFEIVHADGTTHTAPGYQVSRCSIGHGDLKGIGAVQHGYHPTEGRQRSRSANCKTELAYVATTQHDG